MSRGEEAVMLLGRRDLVRVGALVGALGVVGCSAPRRGAAPSIVAASSPSALGARSSDAPATAGPVELGQVDQGDPDSVADAVAVALSVHDARSDGTSQDVWGRALPLLGGDLEAQAAGAVGVELERPDNRWVMMQGRGAWDVVEHIERTTDDPVPDTEAMALRQRGVRVRAVDETGWSGLVRTTRYWLTLTRDEEGAWRVEQMHSEID